MTFESKENDPACLNEVRKSRVKFQVKCNLDKKDAPVFKKESQDGSCDYLFTTEHIAGCGFDMTVLLGL